MTDCQVCSRPIKGREIQNKCEAAAHRAMNDIEHSLKEFAYYLTEIKKLP